jgi:AcrR family transcriptional regulator
VSRSSYYFHYGSKEEILGELDAMTARRAATEIAAQATRPDTSLAAEVSVLVAGLARRASRMPKDLLAPAMVRAMRGLPYVGRLPDEDSDFGRTLAEVFERAQARGEISRDEDAAEMAAVLASMLMEGMLRWAYGTTRVTDLRDVLQWRAEVFLAGVRTRN